ncbi:MAG: hypothetical protein EOO10_08625 [Chitinophagaceae bacterium]|nr:MAG: hypothetical protein EOO10_08625 [Chitinophagaceae bacterium]
MTLQEFSLLPESDKATFVWSGKFQTYRNEEGFTIMLYKVEDFYVEVYYETNTNKRIAFIPIDKARRAELYFEFILN